MTESEWRPRLRDDLRLQHLEDGAVVLDRANERVHQLNEVGAWILERVDGRATAREIAEQLVRRYDVTRARALDDVRALLTRLRALDILQ